MSSGYLHSGADVLVTLTALMIEHAAKLRVRIPRAAAERVPSSPRIMNIERMSRPFVKNHLDDGRALHRFTWGEAYAEPHDHPWAYETTVIDGGYV